MDVNVAWFSSRSMVVTMMVVGDKRYNRSIKLPLVLA